MSEPILSIRNLCVYFDVPGDGWFGAKKILRAVDDVSFYLGRSETLGIVGESGCGKSTLARAILGLVHVTSGEVRFEGQDLARLSPEKLRELRRHLQIIFQDPLSSLDPRMNVGQIIGEPLRSFFPRMTAAERQTKVVEMMGHVGLLPEHINRYPHEFSGGQAQRIGIARALILRPEVVVCDEPVSALDVSIKAQIVNLLADLQAKFGVSLLFIAHDLASVRHVSHRVMVLYLGKVMELARWDEIYRAPRHPYTQALIQAIPPADPSALARIRQSLSVENFLLPLLRHRVACFARDVLTQSTAVPRKCPLCARSEKASSHAILRNRFPSRFE